MYEVVLDEEINNHATMARMVVDISNMDKDKPSVNVSLKFNRYYNQRFGSDFVFRLRSVRVEFSLSGCLAVESSINHGHLYETKTETEFEAKKSSSLERQDSHSDTGRVGGSLSVKPGVEAGLSLDYRNSINQNNANEQSVKGKRTQQNISHGGDGHDLIFCFDPPPGMSHLSGKVTPEEWFQMSFVDVEATVKACLLVSSDEIDIRCMGGYFPAELVPRKHRILRAFALSAINYRPYLSKCSIALIPFEDLSVQSSQEHSIESVADDRPAQ